MAREFDVLYELANTAGWLADEDIPTSVWIDTDAGQQNSAHWSATRALMISVLHRRLKPREVAVLSLSRGFGPIPGVPNGLVQRIYQKLFPTRRNDHGGYYSWETLSEILFELAATTA
jgi:hypothetical protein